MTKRTWIKDDDEWSLNKRLHRHDTLKPAIYNIVFSLAGWYLKPVTPKHDTIIETGICSRICADMDRFWAAKDTYTKFGFLHKRGVLMIGYPGTGKTMSAMLLARHIVEHGGVAIITPQDTDYLRHTSRVCADIRETNPDLALMLLLEDVETYYDGEPEQLLSLLDGQHQVGNIIYAATTNFPDKLDERLLDRPGRFDDIVWVGEPEAAVRRAYLASVLPSDSHNHIDRMVGLSEGFLLSHLREMIALTFVMGRTPEEAAATIRAVQERNKANNKAKLEANTALVARIQHHLIAPSMGGMPPKMSN